MVWKSLTNYEHISSCATNYHLYQQDVVLPKCVFPLWSYHLWTPTDPPSAQERWEQLCLDHQ